MRRTASHIMSSPNAAQLEMRILANHGADPRFAFLRGRWSRAWRLTKGKLRLELEAERKRKEELAQKSSSATLGGLAGYGSSGEDDSEDEGIAAEVRKDILQKSPSPVRDAEPNREAPTTHDVDADARKAPDRRIARRTRLQIRNRCKGHDPP